LCMKGDFGRFLTLSKTFGGDAVGIGKDKGGAALIPTTLRQKLLNGQG
jgi:hypothetical protein